MLIILIYVRFFNEEKITVGKNEQKYENKIYVIQITFIYEKMSQRDSSVWCKCLPGKCRVLNLIPEMKNICELHMKNI